MLRQARHGLAGFLCGASVLVLQAVMAAANPAGGSLVAGSATITANGNILTINQGSNRAIINWQGFSIGAGETTRINLPSSVSAILNRVTGADPSRIAGQLSSNGQVYLINPNGIVVGPNGRIETGAFVASTLNVPDAAFLNGGGLTFKGESGAAIRVLGEIKTDSGDAVLIGAMVDNQGRITAPNGQAILGAGGEVLYLPDGQSDIVIKAPPGTGAASVSNSGVIAAASAQLKAAGNPYALAVNNAGLVSTPALHRVGGRILLDGGAGDVVNSGSLAAESGAVMLNGGNVTVGGAVDVSGPAGGGNVTIQAADKAVIEAPATIAASAAGQGDGGAVTIKAASADFKGAIAARGGSEGGGGGRAEISGRTLAFAGTVDLTAPQGRTGDLLLDPAVVNICNSCATTPAAIAAALATANTTVSADDLITVDSAIVSNSANTLTLNSFSISLNAGIAIQGTLVFHNTLGALGGVLTSGSGAAISAAQVNILGNYVSTDLAGKVTAPVLHLDQPDVTASLLRINNAANAISTLELAGTTDLSGAFDVRSASALTVTGKLNSTADITIVAGGNLTIAAGSLLTTNAGLTLASQGGTFVNNAGSALVAGASRVRFYAATDIGFSDGGLGYVQYNPVAFGDDPFPAPPHLTYIAQASTLPVMTIAAVNQSKTYGDANPFFTTTLHGGSSANLALPVQVRLVNGPAVNAGTYILQPFNAISSVRALRFANGTLTVNKAPLTVTANDATRLTGAANPAFSASFSGLKNGDNAGVLLLSFGTLATSKSPAGNYAILVAGFTPLGLPDNYAPSFVNGTLHVTEAPPPVLAGAPQIFVTLSSPSTPVTLDPASLTVKDLTLTTVDMSGLNAGRNVTTNPLIGTPLENYGSEASKVIASFLAQTGNTSNGKPLTEVDVLRVLGSSDIDAATKMWGLLVPFLTSDMQAILARPEAQWTQAEKSFVAAFSNYVQQQRQAAANKALADYEAWAKDTVEQQRKLVNGSTGIASIYMSAIIASTPPVPPHEFIDEVLAGMSFTDSQAAKFVLINDALGSYNVINQGAATAIEVAGLGFTLGGKGTATSDLPRALRKFAFPHADVKVVEGTRVLSSVGKAVGLAGAVAEVVGAAVQIGVGAALYSQQADFLTNFANVINSYTQPVSAATLKGLTQDQLKSYFMVQGATGTIDPYSNPLPTGKPTMTLNQILNIIKQS